MITRRFDELTAREFHDIARLRSAVFVVEQDCVYLDLDGRDVEPGTEHHWVPVEGEVACYARSLPEPAGVIRIGRVVTAPARRDAGLAATLIASLVEHHAGSPLVLDAQSHLADWYSRLGFVAIGTEFLEDGIPHVPMRRDPA